MRLKHRIEFALVRGGLALGSLFPWSWISGTGALMGRFAFHVLRVRRRVTLENLRLALGERTTEAERRRIAADCYAQFGRSYWEYFALPAFRRRRVLERVDYSGLEHLEAARAAGGISIPPTWFMSPPPAASPPIIMPACSFSSSCSSGPPGTSCMMVNTSTVIPRKVGMMSRKRRMK